jgi:uncharacterized membrane protein
MPGVNSDLVVMTFDRVEMAKTVYAALKAMRKSRIFGLGETVILNRGSADQVWWQHVAKATTALPGLLADLITGSPGGKAPQRGGVGIENDFVSAVGSALREDSSALLVFLDSEGLSDTSELLAALSLFRGTIHHTTLAPGTLARLQKML